MFSRMKTFFLILVLGLARAGIDECGHKLLERCVCGKRYVDRTVMFTVNCTNTGFTNADMLAALPEQTNVLIFTGNHVTALPSNVFGEANDLNALKVIDMSNNGIREIKGKTFHRVANVERLILNHNNISVAEGGDGNFHHPRVFSNFVNLEELHLTDAFADNTDSELADDLRDIFVNSNLTKLYKLHLEQNEIRNFKDDKVFCDLPNLHDVYLGDNNIPGLNFDVLCLKKLRYLDLEFNNITELSQKDLDAFDKLASRPDRGEALVLAIGNNPIGCDAAARNLYAWIRKTAVKIRNVEKLECVQWKYGKRYAINLKSLADSRHAKVSRALTVLLVVLVCILLTLLAAYGYLKKDAVRNKLSPVFDAISKKVQYTTIESQDV